MTSRTAAPGPIGFTHHDHSHCVSTALAAVEAQCVEEGLRLTKTRRRVLEILLEQHKALGAYAILDLLRAEGMPAQPPVAYRALDFLSQHGFVHRIERLNAFIACTHPGEDHAPAFMICRKCDAVAETHTGVPKGALQRAAAAAGFKIERTVVEAEGICPACQETQPA